MHRYSRVGQCRHQCGGICNDHHSHPNSNRGKNRGATLGWENARKGRGRSHILAPPGTEACNHASSARHAPGTGLGTAHTE